MAQYWIQTIGVSNNFTDYWPEKSRPSPFFCHSCLYWYEYMYICIYIFKFKRKLLATKFFLRFEHSGYWIRTIRIGDQYCTSLFYSWTGYSLVPANRSNPFFDLSLPTTRESVSSIKSLKMILSIPLM